MWWKVSCKGSGCIGGLEVIENASLMGKKDKNFQYEREGPVDREPERKPTRAS